MRKTGGSGAENPFRYGDVATGVYFTDRAAELAELMADVRSGQNIAIISPRRYGKTSLVTQAAERLRREQVLVAYLDLFRATSEERLADHLAAAIYEGLVAPLERAWQRAIEVFQSLPLRPKITINPDGTPAFEFTAGPRERDLDGTIERLLEMPGRIAQQRKRRVAFILDEFQEVVTLDPQLPAVMRSIFQFQAEVAHVYLGSKRHLMQRVFTDANEPLYRSARVVLLGPIADEDFASFIRERFASTGVPLAPAAVEQVLSVGEGHPHDTQRLCYTVWSLAVGRAEGATVETVEQAVEQVLQQEGARFAELWEALTPNQRRVLAALAVEPGRPYGEAYRRQHRLGSASSAERAVEALLARGWIEAEPGAGYRVPDIFLRAWLGRLAVPRRL